MYITGNEITVRWILPPTASPLTASDYDVRLVPATLAGTYTNAGVTSFVAPTAAYSGNMQYAFTPTTKGRWRILLCTGTGASTIVLDEKDFWVFDSESLSENTLTVLGKLLYPEQPEGYTGITKVTVNWYTIEGICQDPDNLNHFYITGKKDIADLNGSVARIDRADNSVTEWVSVLWCPDPRDIAVNNGIITVLEASPFRARWATTADPSVTYTACTFDSSTSGHGSQGLNYDPYYQAVFARSDAGMWVSLDGKDFKRQSYNLGYSENGLPSYFYSRTNVNSVKAWWTGNSVLGGGAEDIQRGVDTTSPLVAVPMTYTTVTRAANVYGGSVTSQSLCGLAQNPDGNAIWVLSRAGYLIGNTTGAVDGWSGTPQNLSSLIPGTNANNIGSIVDFGKMYIAVDGPGNDTTNVFLESADGSSWAATTDERFTAIAPRGGSTSHDRYMQGVDHDVDGVPQTLCGIHVTTDGSSYDIWYTT